MIIKFNAPKNYETLTISRVYIELKSHYFVQQYQSS